MQMGNMTGEGAHFPVLVKVGDWLCRQDDGPVPRRRAGQAARFGSGLQEETVKKEVLQYPGIKTPTEMGKMLKM